MKFPIIVLLAAGAFSAPFNIDEFNKWIPSVGGDDCVDPHIKQDVTSIYSYEGETLSTVQGSTSDSTGLKLRAKILIHPQGACRYRMQINNPELLVKSKNQQRFQTADESWKFSRELQAQDIVFQTSKGRITKLFPEAREATHVLNIKRGILSTLQLDLNAKEEVDVNGRCKVDVFKQDGVVFKSKQLSDCTERAHNELGIQTATFAHSKMPVKPLNSTSTCAYNVEGNKIMSVECLESHIFRPFSAGYQRPAGAVTTVTQVLKHIGEKQGGRIDVSLESKSTEGVSLIYEHESEEMKPDNSILDKIDNVMSSLVDTTKKNNLAAKQNSAHEFTHLVNLMRKLDSKRMTPVMAKYFSCDKSGICSSSNSDLKSVYRQYVLDALTYCGTPTCVSAVHDVIIEGEVTGEYMNMFLQGISLVAKPTKQMIRDVLNIASKKPSRQVFLSLGTLIRRYCSINAEGCQYGKRNPVTQAELFLEDKLANSCTDSDDYERVEEILMTMKAIGNAGRPTRAIKTLLRCAKNSRQMNVTTSAFESLRHMPCSDDAASIIHGIFEDVNIDTEKRIQSYLALMKCPTESTVSRIVNQLKTEKSNQVGSFVLSHLDNIKKSSDPRHTRTQELLSSMFKVEDFKKFDLAITRYSKALEGSLYSKYLKSGVAVEGHVIYNSDNILPRSALFNMTANILDVPVNMIEMAARVEGIETLMEGIFGPYGYIPDDSIMKIFNVTFTRDDIQKLRSRRSVDEDIEENIAEMHEKVNKKATRPEGFLTMKVFGHEMRVFSYDDIMWAADEIDNMNVIELLLKVAKGGHKTFTKSVMFLEMTHTIPTGLGLPMKLKLTGSAVGSLELNGKFDIRNMFWGPSSLEVKGFVRPSAVVEVSGQMGVHSHFVDTGIFVNTSMFTSQMMKGSVVYKEGQQFRINIDAPEEPIEFFNISSTPYMFVDEKVALIKGAPRRISPDFCLNSKMVIGLGICTSMAVPVAFRDYEAPYFPLSGPAHFGMRLVKADPKLTAYQFLVSVSKKSLGSGRELLGSFEVGTPGATYARRLSGVVKYTETRKVRTLTIGSLEAKNNAELTVSYHNDTNRFEVDFSTNVITNKPIKMKLLYFNDTNFIAKEMGILASAEYDWYKFQHVSKFVRKIESGSYLLHTKTSYWPKKHLTGEIEYMPKSKSLTVRMGANQFNQRLIMNGRFVSTDSEKGMNFTVTSTMGESSMYAGIKNTDSEKKFIFNTTCLRGMRNEFVWGYYKTVSKHELRFDADIAGRTAAVYADYSNLRTGWHGVKIGASFKKNVIGLMSSYNMESKFDQQACIIAFYNDKRPAKTCLILSEVPSTYTSPAFKRLTWTVEVMKKTAEIAFDVKNTEKSYGLTSTVFYQSKELMKNTLELTYGSIWDSQLKMTSTVGKRSVSTKFFTKTEGELTLFGVEAAGFSQMMKLQGTYSKTIKEEASVHGVIFEGWVNKKLPLSYTFLVEYSKKAKGVTSILKIKEYTAKSSLIWLRPESSEYSIVSDTSVTKKDFVIFANKMTDILILGDVEKAYKFLWEFTVWNKNFKYGYDVAYENQSTDSTSSYAITTGVDFARNKRSSMKTTFSNSEEMIDVAVDVNYLPGRKVSHYARYSKTAKQLDVSIEFLPKMYVKLMGRLDQTEGWKFTTDLKFSWADYERSMQWITSYVKKADIKGLNFKFTAFNQKFFVGAEYNGKSKTVIFTLTAFKRSIRLVTFWLQNKGLAGMKLTTEKHEGNMIIPTEIIETVVQFSKTLLAFEIRTTKKSYAKGIAIFDKPKGVASLELSILKKSIFKIMAEYMKSKKTGVTRVFILNKERFQMMAKYNDEEKTMLVSFDALKKNWNIMFSGKWNGDKKKITVSSEFMKRVIGFSARFDPYNYVAGAHIFYQKNIVGWSMMYDPTSTSVVYNVTISPRLSAQLALQVIDDRIISATIQRKIGSEVVNEVVFKYELASSASSFIFEWNKETVQKIKDLVMPALKTGFRDVNQMLKKIVEMSKTLSTDMVVKGTAKMFSMINNADRMFDEFDFVAAKNQAGEMIVSMLKKSAKLTSESLKIASKRLMKLHQKMPSYMEQIKKYSKEGMALAVSTIDSTNKIMMAAYKVAKNITESGIPVARTAVKLAKEFKIRGRTTEAIIKDLMEMIKKIVKSYKINLSNQLTTLKTDVKEYIIKTNLPYTKKNVGEIYEEYSSKIKAFDLETKTREWTKKIMELKVKGMTIKQHLDVIIKKFDNLPEDMKKAVVTLIRTTRMRVKKMKKLVSKIESFFQPMTNCMINMKKSVKKHFGPLVTKGNKMIMTTLKNNFNDIYLPTKEYWMSVVKFVKEVILPIVKPVYPLHMNLRDQLLAIEVLQYRIGKHLDNLYTKSKVNLEKKYADMMTLYNRYAKSLKIDTSLTAEETAEKIIDESVLLTKKAMEEMKRVYNDRKQIYSNMKVKSIAKWKVIADYVSDVISKPVPDMINDAFIYSGKISMDTMKEMANLLDQLADIDISTPLSVAWTAHMKKIAELGVNDKIINAIATAKKVNVTEAIIKIVKDMKKMIFDAYMKIDTRVRSYYVTVEKVYKYIRSIPKKDFEEFYTEVESAFLKSQKDLYELVKKIVNSVKAKTMLAKTEVLRLYAKYSETYEKPLKELYADVKKRTMLVYDEVKDECVYVKDFYKAIVTGMVMEKYEELQIAVKEKYNEMYNKAMAFYRKYEHKTWEEIGAQVYGFGKIKFDKVYAVANMRMERLRTVTRNAIELMKTYYEKLMAVALKEKTRLENIYNEKIKPKAIQVYEKAVAYSKAKGKEYYDKLAAVYKKIYSEIVKTYDDIKKMSIRQLYVKTRELTTKMVKDYVKKLKAVVEKNYEKVYGKSMELKQKIETEMLPVLREEFESIINQTLRASVIIANETIKAFAPHYEIVKQHSMKYFKDGKVMTANYYVDAMRKMSNVKMTTVEKYNKVLAEAKVKYGKWVSHYETYMNKIKNHPKYLEVVNHEVYLKIKEYIEKISKMINEKISVVKIKIQELKNHPKIEEIKMKLMKIMDDPQMKPYLKAMKQIKESGKFTLMKLKVKIMPIMKMMQMKISQVPSLVVSHLRFFRHYPEECFWTSFETGKNFIVNAKYDAKTTMNELKKSTKALLVEITDEPTKQFAANVQKKIVDAYVMAVAFPEKMKAEVVKIYKEQLEMLKARWAKIVAQWKSSALYPIVTHEVWSEIADEIMSHELVVEIKYLASEGMKKAATYNAELVKTIKEFVKNKKEMLKAKYDRLVEKYNMFLDETTMENIVEKAVEIYGKIMVQRQKVMNKLMGVYSKAKDEFMVYKAKAVEFGKMRYMTMKEIWSERYPKVMSEMKTAYKKYIVKMEAAINKLTDYYYEMTSKITANVMKTWNESILKEKFIIFKGMTVGETVAVVKKMPENVRMFYKRMSEIATSEFDRLVRPHMNKVVTAAKFIGNEINETVVFVYKYYNMKENTLGMYKKAYQKIKQVMPKVSVFTKDYLNKFAKMSVKGFHYTMVYVDNMDLKPYIAEMKALVPDFKKYVSIEGENGRLVLRVSHPKEIEPRFSYHVEKVKGKVNEIASKIKSKTVTITKALLDDLKLRTMELRKDLNMSILAHSKLAEHIKSRSTALKENGIKRSASLKNYVNRMLNETRIFMKFLINDFKNYAKDIYEYSSAAAKSIASCESLPEAYERVQMYVQEVKTNMRPLYTLSKRISENMMAKTKQKYTAVLNKAKTYFTMVKSATKQWRDGTEFRTAFKDVEASLQEAYTIAKNKFNKLYNRTVITISKPFAPEDVEIIKEYLTTHRNIFGKYAKQFYRLYKWNKIRLDRAIRKSKMLFRYKIVHPVMKINPLRTYAMIFGKSHVMTFDGRFYDFVKYAKSDCTYLLARDFKNGNFTILSQRDSIIVKTPEMDIKIHSSGRVSGTVTVMSSGVARTKVVKDLPIETEDGYCKIWKKHIKCSFKQGVFLRCDIGSFLCSVELSGWHYGKSQGLLGTNNNEMFDEFKQPDNTIASTVTDLANSWLVSKDSQCLTGQLGNEAPTCNKAPSDRCFELFKIKTSPFAKHFTTVDALPFLKACLVDSADCDNKEPVEISHCNSTAAYRHMLYLKGVKAPKVSDCEPRTYINGKRFKKGEKWTQKPTKEVDIVVMVSGRRTASKFRRSIASMLYSTNKNLAKMGFNTRYALVSYGTGSKSGYDARSHTHSGEYFSDEKDIATAIKTMAYTGEEKDSNDYYHAILRAATMSFRPGATKMFFLFNFDQYKSSWFGPTLDETKFALKYKANATLFVFDDFTFKPVKNVDVLGKTATRVYLKPYRPVEMSTEFPVNAFTKLVRREGGMFINNLRPTQAKALTAALSDAAKLPLTMNMKSCQSCVMRHHTPVCRSDITIQC